MKLLIPLRIPSRCPERMTVHIKMHTLLDSNLKLTRRWYRQFRDLVAGSQTLVGGGRWWVKPQFDKKNCSRCAFFVVPIIGRYIKKNSAEHQHYETFEITTSKDRLAKLSHNATTGRCSDLRNYSYIVLTNLQ